MAQKGGADLECPSVGRRSLTLLQQALDWDRYDAARLPINAGANVNIETSAAEEDYACQNADNHPEFFTCRCHIRGARSPIALAAKSDTCVDLIPELIGKCATPPACNPVLSRAIFAGASVDTVLCLIGAGADVNMCAASVGTVGEMPLSAAVQIGNLQIIQILLKAGADPNGALSLDLGQMHSLKHFQNGRFRSPLFYAIEGRWHVHGKEIHRIVRLLLEAGADPNIPAFEIVLGQDKGYIPKDLFDRNSPVQVYPLQAAVKYDDMTLVKLLLQQNAMSTSEFDIPALAVAIQRYNFEMIRLLLSHGSDPNGLSRQPYCQSALEGAVDMAYLAIIDLLLEAGGSINNPPASYGGRTPLQRAAENGDKGIIDHLLTCGASMLSEPAAVDGTSVIQGFIRHGLHEYVLQALRVGASPNRASAEGSSPLVVAVLHNDIVSLKLLLDWGANLHQYAGVDYEDEYIVSDECLEPAEEVLSWQLSPIQWAVAVDDVNVARYLCKVGAEVNQSPCIPSENMALHLAASCDSYASAQILLESQVEILAFSNGKIALCAAIEIGSKRMLDLLLVNGADPNQRCYDGGQCKIFSTPLGAACFHGYG